MSINVVKQVVPLSISDMYVCVYVCMYGTPNIYGIPNVGYTGMCHRSRLIFYFQKSRTGHEFELFLRTGPDF